MSTLVIGLVGRKRSGKDLLGSLIRDRFPGSVERVSIAAPLKEDFARRFDTTPEAIEIDKEFWRPGLQWWGHALRGIWTAKAFIRIENSEAPICVVTDARYPEQFDLIRNRGGILAHIARTDDLAEADAHESERNTDLAQTDFRISNPGTRDGLEAAAEPLLQAIAVRLWQ